jgi:universal stress protein E
MRLIAGVKIDAAVVAATPAQEKAYKAAVRRDFYEALGRYGIAKSRGHLRCGDPAIELPAVARAMRASLVVMGAISRSGLKRIFIGNTAEQVLDSLRCDLLIVKPPNRQ